MGREARKIGNLGMIALTLLAAQPPFAVPGELETAPMQGAITIRALDDLVTLSASQLEQLYCQSGPGCAPTGKVVGRALYPDSHFPKARSNAARLAWQGKVFYPETSTATNRFFGVKVIKGNVYVGPSWLDGAASMILDYEGTSRIYGNYRDEIRQVAPDLYLGLMYDRTTAPPTLKMYFAFRVDSH
jgi:hypothetical protein